MSEFDKCALLSVTWAFGGAFCAVNAVLYAVRAALIYGAKP